jgi:hypothetical protein
MGNTKYHGGGTPKGVSKPRRNLTKETCGVEARGVMAEREAMPNYHFGKRSPQAGK